MSFVHLRIHTEFSLSDSVIRIPSLMDAVAANAMPAVGLSDQSNLFALVKFYRQAQKRGIKPIIGADLWVRSDEAQEPPHRLTLFCRNRAGYLQLSELITRSFRDGQHHGLPMIERSWFDGHTDGLIALSGAREGEVGRALLAGREDLAVAAAGRWAGLFPNAYYLELMRTGRDGEEAHVAAAVALAAEKGLPVLATNDVRFLSPDDFEAHEARVCIHDGRTLDDPRRARRYSDQQYLRTADEMTALFDDLPEALENSVEIARRCNLELRLGENFLPAFPVPDGSDVETHLRREAGAGLEARLARLQIAEGEDVEARDKPYRERLERELKVIVNMGFPGYFLIVADFIRWSRGHGVPVGPGRGSGAGSVVAWALGITDLDPLAFDLLFERFLNPERVSMPDFDVDFCMEGRDRVIDYVAERYGRDHVSQIITYGTMAARAVVRDVGRVLGHPYGYVDRIAKMIPFELGMTLDKALEQDEEFAAAYRDDDEIRTLIDLARKLEGLTRNAGKHAGGVVIAPAPLTEYTPLYVEQGGGNAVTQLDKDDVEAVGLVKFDFLGLRTLTIIDHAVATINAARAEQGESPLDMAALPMDDKATFDLIKRGETTAVFQVESRGMKDLIRKLQPDTFEDVIALVALFRPGPLQSGMVDDFINRKHGRAEVIYPHPSLEPVLKPTYGVILYQEQVMQAAQVLAGYTLGGADLLRRAMGKKKAEEMAKQRSVFIEGATANGIQPTLAAEIFDLIEKFAGYGFNKSHSAAYAVLTYQTAWLKAHYPEAFMAAVLSADMDHTDKVVTLIDEARSMKLEILPPDVNESDYAFTVAGPRAVRYGLGAIKGVGRGAIEMLIAERAQGRFRDLDDLCRRIDTQRANRRVLEALIRAGAFDSLGMHRAALMNALGESLQRAEQQKSALEAGQNDMFGLAEPAEPEVATVVAAAPDVAEWDDLTRLTAEKETLGLYLTGHPITRYEDDLAHIVTSTIGAMIAAEPEPSMNGRYGGGKRVVTVAGLVADIRRRGNRVSVTLDDRTGRIEATLFDDIWQQHRGLIVKDQLLICEGKLGFDEFINGYRVTVRGVYGIDAMRDKLVRALVIDWRSEQCARADFIGRLQAALEPFKGGRCKVAIRYRGPTAQADLPLDDEWRVKPTEALLTSLAELAGSNAIRLKYGRPQTSPEALTA
ncbi:MAG TPA: DNA polymerase III subunit alpha [Gammaproteobacteria bacterium]|nr:DNA polymerase III subunit alpha [Gammaproteobacteria bacterium]